MKLLHQKKSPVLTGALEAGTAEAGTDSVGGLQAYTTPGLRSSQIQM